MYSKIFSAKLAFCFLFLSVVGCVQQFSGAKPSFDPSPYKHSYNSPDLNIYWTEHTESSSLTVHGAIQNIYYTNLVNVHLYVDALDENQKTISSGKQIIMTLELEEAGTFTFRLALNKKPAHIIFSFLYDYAEWRGSVTNSGTFQRPLESDNT